MATEAGDGPALVSTSTVTKYDAFLSYTHRDSAVAVPLQRQLERLTKPWWRRRELHVFRDESALPAGPALWESLVSALSQSTYLIVLASVAAARSEWTDREVAWWLEHRSADHLILAVVDGDLRWDDHAGRFDPATSTCLPRSLMERLAEEPHWIDLRGVATDQGPERLLSASAAIVAAITGRDKDEILGEDLRQHRRTRRTAVSALAVISVLAVLAVVAAVVAMAQRNSAVRSATVAEARAFAASAEANSGQDLGRSLLYAATGHTLHEDTSSDAALIQALSSNPHLVRFIPHPTTATALTWLGTSDGLAEGGRGYLTLTDATTGSSRTVKISGSVSALASTADGAGVVAATSAHTILLIDAQSGRTTWQASTSSSPIVSLSADTSSGLTAELDQDGAVTVRHLADGQPVATNALQLPGYDPKFVGFLDDGARLVIGDVEGEVEILGLPDLSVLSPWSPSQGPGDFLPPSAYVDDGSSVTFAFPGRFDVTVSTVAGRRDVPHFPPTNITDTSTFAISDALDEVALDVSGQLEVTQPPDELHPEGIVTSLTGVSATNSVLAFSADGRLLAGTNGPMTAIWAPRSLSGAAQALPDPLLSPCMACGNAPAAVDSHDSTLIWQAAQPDYTDHLVCRVLPSGSPQGDLELPLQESVQALAVTADGSTLIAADNTDGVLGWPLQHGCPSGQARPFATGALSGDLSIGVLTLKDGSVIMVGQNQAVARVDRTGRILQQSPPVQPGANYLPPPVMAAAPDGIRFALGRPDGSVTTYRTAGTTVRQGWQMQMGQQVEGVAYVSGTRMAVSTASGDVVVLDAATGAVVHRLAGAQGFAVAGVNGLIVGIGGIQDRAAVWSASDGGLMATFDFVPIALPLSSPGRLARVTSGYATTLLPDGTGMWFFEAGTNPTRWDLDPASWVTAACQKVGRSLTPAEWKAVTGSSAPKDLACG